MLERTEEQPLSFLAKLSGFVSRKRAPAHVPDGMRIYAIGDIHGCSEQLDRLMAKIREDQGADGPEPWLVFLGDYVDRGPDSKGVIERLLTVPMGFNQVCLLGNHDQTLLDFLGDSTVYRSWRGFGAPETLLSYGVLPPRFDDEREFETAQTQLARALPQSHLVFLRGLQNSVAIGGYFFVHAGARPGIALDKQVPQDMLWIRDEFLGSNYSFGKVIIHGHTPVPEAVRRANRIGVDTGAYATGRLTAAVLEGENCRFLSTC